MEAMQSPGRAGDDDLVGLAVAGDEVAFAQLADRYRRELHVHCYRLLGSFTDAEDLVQEALLRAWTRRSTYEGRASYRAWLYRIATNACLDRIRRSGRRVREVGAAVSPAEVPWLGPYPDRLLDELSPSEGGPEAEAVARETIELAFITAIQRLPPRQRAVLVCRHVLEWTAEETAETLDMTVASVNSALQRAVGGLRSLPAGESYPFPRPSAPTSAEADLLRRYIDAHATADTGAIVALLHDDVRFTMPPEPTSYVGRPEVAEFFIDAFGASALGEYRLVATHSNRHPAAANYVKRPDDDAFRAMSLDVLRFLDGRIVEITTFEPSIFAAFGLPDVL